MATAGTWVVGDGPPMLPMAGGAMGGGGAATAAAAVVLCTGTKKLLTGGAGGWGCRRCRSPQGVARPRPQGRRAPGPRGLVARDMQLLDLVLCTATPEGGR